MSIQKFLTKSKRSNTVFVRTVTIPAVGTLVMHVSLESTPPTPKQRWTWDTPSQSGNAHFELKVSSPSLFKVVAEALVNDEAVWQELENCLNQ